MATQARRGEARHGMAGPGLAGQRRHGKAGQGADRHGIAGEAGQGVGRRGITQTGERDRGINCAHFSVNQTTTKQRRSHD